MFCYKRASLAELEYIWNKHIEQHPDDARYIRWKKQFIMDNANGDAVTFVVLADNIPVGEGTLLLNPNCKAIRGRTNLCDGLHTANVNALRIQPAYEGQGHISALMKEIEHYASIHQINHLTIGVEPCETRNLGIYLHWGYNTFIMSETEENCLVLYYKKILLDR